MTILSELKIENLSAGNNVKDEVEYLVSPLHEQAFNNNFIQEKSFKLDEVNQIISSNQKKLDELNTEIDKFTNTPERFDYAVAIGSEVLTRLLYAFWVGEFSFEEYKADAHKHINKFIEKLVFYFLFKNILFLI